MANYKQSLGKTQTSGRLTADEIEFIRHFGVLAQRFNTPKLAKLFGVSKQAIQYHIDKSLEASK